MIEQSIFVAAYQKSFVLSGNGVETIASASYKKDALSALTESFNDFLIAGNKMCK